MNSVLLKHYLLKKLQENDLTGAKKGKVSVHIPIQEKLLNYVFETLISTSEDMKDFESIVFSELDNNEFLVSVNHRKLTKTIRCAFHNIGYSKYSEPILTIEFLKGFRFFEKIALDSILAFQTSWKWVKTKLHEEKKPPEKEKPVIDVSSSGLTINLAEVLNRQNMGYMNKMIVWEDFTTKENKLIIDFSIKM